jgi:hypothetical protein
MKAHRAGRPRGRPPGSADCGPVVSASSEWQASFFSPGGHWAEHVLSFAPIFAWLESITRRHWSTADAERARAPGIALLPESSFLCLRVEAQSGPCKQASLRVMHGMAKVLSLELGSMRLSFPGTNSACLQALAAI